MDNNRPRRRPTRNIDGFVVPEHKQADKLAPRPFQKAEPTPPLSQLAASGSLLNTTIAGKINPSNELSMPKVDKAKKPKKKRSKKKIVGLVVLALIVLA